MSIANTFPVFEADQVLTNRHLNDLFNYLDQQSRLTRCKLLGSGIVCGLEISHANDTISITKGCGLTSQGYIILFCDHIGENGYKFFIPYTRHALPADIDLIVQCGDANTMNIPFYTSNTDAAGVQEDIFLLLTQGEMEELADKTKVTSLSQGTLDNYAVVLFLDAAQLNLKNCDTNDCNDKGSEMDFEVRPLLVNKRLLSLNGTSNNGTDLKFIPPALRRYNVPVNNLNSSDDVLNGFVNLLLSDSILDTLAKDLNFCFAGYGSLLNGINNYSFGSGSDFKNALNFIRQSFPYLIQYYYDFIYDLIKAVYEFKYKAHTITSECCGDEMKFPFHLTLGDASSGTAGAQSAYRQYFIYSPLFDAQSQGSNELKSLLMRMILMHQGFLLTRKNLQKGLPEQIRITPSTYGRNFLSDRCIPYYYKVVHDNADVVREDLYYYWNYGKTKRGNARFNLSYDPTPYNHANSVVNPLYYDIEWYDFFRIEGHIGKNINTALSDIVSKKQVFNLPFDVIALSADYIGALVTGDDPRCIIQDLESDYRILIAEFICKLHDAWCSAARQKFTPPLQILEPLPFGISTETAKKTAKKANTAKKVAPGAAAALPPEIEMIHVAIDHPFISGLVNEFQSARSYIKGTTLLRLCSPGTGTTGSYYINSIKSNNGRFVDPDPSNPSNSAFFEFIDSVESMLQMLFNEDLSSFNPASFKLLYSAYERDVAGLKSVLLARLQELEKGGTVTDFGLDYLLDLFVDNIQLLLRTCIVEKLEALKNEYLRRLAQYRLAKNFNYYFKKHGGIEHKAGVPRAGTFILVYHEERKNRFVDPRSLFINKELSETLLSNFRELLQPDADLDTLESKAKLLAVSTLYKDPALYLRFKDVMQQYLDNCHDLPPGKKNQITTIINRPPENPTYQLTDGMVIADFYVPYMCCNDCLPIAYILPPAPQALTVLQSDPVCDQENKNFTVTLTVSGGTPPYSFTANNTTLPGNQVTLASGSPDTLVTIKDSSAQKVTTTIKSHECASPCDLPCNGRAENCKYILWLPTPRDVLKDAIKHTTQRAMLTLTDNENGTETTIDLMKIFTNTIDKALIKEKKFDDILAKLVDAINTEVKSKAPRFLGNNQPMFTYDVQKQDPLLNQTLNIERFAPCHEVRLEIAASIDYTTQGQFKFVVFARYDTKGVSIQISGDGQNFEFNVPKFDCVSLDKCLNKSTKLCQQELKIKEISVDRDPAGQLIFSVVPAGAFAFDKFFWYFHFGSPMFSTNATPTTRNLSNQIFVKVVAIDSTTGCFAFSERTINLG